MIVTEKKIFCDVCKAEIKSIAELKQVSIPISVSDTTYGVTGILQTKSVDLCDICYNNLYAAIKENLADIEEKDNVMIVKNCVSTNRGDNK